MNAWSHGFSESGYKIRAGTVPAVEQANDVD